MIGPQTRLADGERIVWQGEAIRPLCQILIACLILFCCLLMLWLVLDLVEPLILRILLAVPTLLGSALYALIVASKLFSSAIERYVVTNSRIIEIDDRGTVVGRDDIELDSRQMPTIRSGLCGQTVRVATLRLDHGDPPSVQVGPITAAEAARLVRAFPLREATSQEGNK